MKTAHSTINEITQIDELDGSLGGDQMDIEELIYCLTLNVYWKAHNGNAMTIQ